ncbi:cytoplasmic dynein 2 light intermediate chain 1-like isoform X2 [Xenia sp. Carnegie-2017]|uniref:cytoplasmic dynein 2 light intermediate chain 1-like isoform X2 n=1 Tax=Xenia sp. Carnegie-2017 TaxID=2897299 RepID=UPI001F03EBEE|nr:cytoplasmic dynein 2 light intermediate chain 1-like isoform X2 [Xenia sp. Carnegie-2017]
MSTERKEKSLWDIAVNKRQEIEIKNNGESIEGKNNHFSEELSILILGSKGSGKSTIVLRFLDKDENPKPTVALDYTFGRRAKSHNMQRDIGHIWELGGGTFLSNLIEVPLKEETICTSSVLIVVDLSKPNELWLTLEVLLKSTRSAIDKLLSEIKNKNPSLANEIQEKAWKRFGDNHVDKSFLDPFPIPLGIVGTKYDIFQDFDPEKRKMISRTLRFIAHSNGAHLQYFSSKAEGLITRTRALFGGLLFRTQTRRPYDLWKAAFATVFPEENYKDKLKNDDITHNAQYAELAVDAVRAQKDEDMERLKRQEEKKNKTFLRGGKRA